MLWVRTGSGELHRTVAALLQIIGIFLSLSFFKLLPAETSYVPARLSGFFPYRDDLVVIVAGMRVETANAEFGMRAGGFGLPISGEIGMPVIIDVLDSLNSGSWSPVQTNVLHDGTHRFEDPQATNHLQRFYRVREE